MATPASAGTSPAAAPPVPEKGAGHQSAPLIGVAASWESDFDTGEPVGLETHCRQAHDRSDGAPEDGVFDTAIGAVASVIPDSLKSGKAPTSSRRSLTG